MPMKIDHITLGHELSQTRRKCLKLTALAGAAYPNNDSFVQILFAQVRALDQLKMSSINFIMVRLAMTYLTDLAIHIFHCAMGITQISILEFHIIGRGPEIANNASQKKRSLLRAIA